MKIVDLKCPSCGGKLLPVEGNSKIVACEYCNSQFVLEEDQVVNYHIHQYGTASPSFGADKGSMDSGKRLLLLFPLAIVIAMFSLSQALRHTKEQETVPAYSFSVAPVYPDSPTEPTLEAVSSAASPLYCAMTEAIFEKPAESLTSQDLEKLKYLRVESKSEFAQIAYSFEDPYETDDFEPTSIKLEAAKWEVSDLANFAGLRKLDLGDDSPKAEIFSSLTQLKGLSCYRAEFTALAEMIDPAQLTELELERVDSLEGIGAFENLEALSIGQIYKPDLKQLVSLKNLKSLSIEEPKEEGEWDNLTDYAALSVLSGLEYLHLDSSTIRDLSFLKSLTSLTELSIEGTEVIGLEPLAGLSQLVSLTLKENSEIQDYSPITRLSNLKYLLLDKDTSQPDPDLAPLSSLETLEIRGFMSVAFLRNMGNVKNLSIHSCNIDEIQALSSMSGLEQLSLCAVWTYAVPLKGLGFVDGMTNLKSLNLGDVLEDEWSSFGRNVEIFGDISNVFNHQGLEEINLNNCVFGIDFGRVGQNPSLKKLEMRKVALIENAYVQTYNGMTDIWYDDVSFDEHVSFLENFPGLEELYLDSNQLTDIQFTIALKNLTHLGLYDNYITDLTPLNQAEHLKYLDIRKNPVGNTVEVREGTVVLK